MSVTSALLILVMVIVLLVYVQQSYGNTEIIKSTVDQKEYLVQKTDDRQAAADYIAKVASSLSQVVDHMYTKFPLSVDVQRLQKNFDSKLISEGNIESGYTSFSINKQKIVLCIRQTDKQFVDYNTMIYVSLHELCHLMTKELDHPPQFWKNFKIILEEAILIGVYKKTDFNASPSAYCGITINNSIV